MKMLAECIRLDKDCASICWEAAGYMSRGSRLTAQVCRLCADICDACAQECEKHQPMEHCRQCAEACRLSAEACRRMTGAAGCGLTEPWKSRRRARNSWPAATISKTVMAVRIVLLILVMGVVAPVCATALPKFHKVFLQTYQPKPGSPLGEAKCLTCHASPGPPKRNSYGKLVEETIHGAGSHDEVTAALLHKIESVDSDGDGWTNGQEIAEGTLPGDPISHPLATPSSSTALPSPQVPDAQPAVSKQSSSGLQRMLMPKHSFHPIIVHFALALFIFGATLEILGLLKRRPNLSEAGFMNMTIGSMAGVAAAATGLVAAYRNGFPWKGTLLIHLILGLTAALGMATTACLGYRASRFRRERYSRVYLALVVISLLLVIAAGFFGGEFVYTELMGM